MLKVIVDDVMTIGRSILKAGIEAVIEHGYHVAGVVCILDREETGITNVLKQNGVKYTSLFKHSDFKFIDQKLKKRAKH